MIQAAERDTKRDAGVHVTRSLAEFVAATTWERLPEAVRTEAKLAIADTVAGAIAALDEPVSRIVRGTLEGEAGTSRIWGARLTTTARNAALLNGTMAHAHDIDDTNPSMRGHPSCPVVPAIHALQPVTQADGKELIAAYVAGVEIETKLGRAMNMTHYNRGWHTTLTLGTLGAAAGCANLLRLAPAQVAAALGIAASMASGLVANFGTMTKPLHSGLAAQNGVLAALLARGGLSASATAIEAHNGFFGLFCGLDNVRAERAMTGLGAPFDVLDPGNIYKQYPTCSLTHCAIDILLEGIASGDIQPNKVTKIACGVGYRCENTLPYHRAETGLQGKFCMEYCLAAAMHYGRVTFAEFTDEAARDPAIQAWYEKIDLYIHPDLTTVESVDRDFTDVVVTHEDGRQFHRRERKAKGDPARRWSPDEFKSKFVTCVAPVLGSARAGEVWERSMQLERLDAAQVRDLY